VSAAATTLRGGLLRGRSRRKRASTRRKARSLEYSLLLTATMCLVAFGVVMVFSASSSASLLGESGDGTYYLKRTLMFGAIGLVALRVLSIPGMLATVRRLTPVILAIAFALLLVTKGIGTSANGAQRWIAFGPVQIQASEIAKLALLLYGASLLARRPQMTRDLRGMMPFLVVAGACCVLIVVEPDLGTAMVTAFSVSALLIAAGAKLRHLALIAGALGLFVLVAVLMEPYRMERLTTFLNPGADTAGAGFQSTQASIAIGSGGIFGVGLGESVQKAFYLPEAHTDMIAAVVGEELGLVGFSMLTGLYVMLGFAGFRTAQRARDRYGRLLAAALTAMILVQASINLFAVLGLAPLTGVTLPFVSYGNSSLIVTLAAVGLLLNIASGGTATSKAKRPPARGRPAAGGLRVYDGGRKTRRTAPARRSGGARAARGDRGGRDRRARGAGAGRRRRAR
jgi:cell division protein FtsW